MSRKNSMSLRIKKKNSKMDRAMEQEAKLERRRTGRAAVAEAKAATSSSAMDDSPAPLKRKTLRRLENERVRLAKKGIKLVKAGDDEDDMDIGAPKKKRMRVSSEA